MRKSHLHYAILNMGTSGATTVLKIILGFVSRTIFIQILGSQLLGLNGLLTSVLTTLSLAEMGIGNAIIYSLYRPVAQKKWSVVRAIMELYRKIYRILAVLVLLIGLAIIPFLPILTGSSIHNVTLYYSILLFNSVISYLLTYNRSLMIANERNYIVSLVDLGSVLFTTILQIITLFIFKNYSLYLIIQVLFTFCGNIVLTCLVRKGYRNQLQNTVKIKVPADIVSKLKKNVIGTFANKVGDVAVNGTVNVLIAMFINLSTVGIYSNYQLIISALQSILFNISNALTSTIGSIAASTESSNKSSGLFFKHQFMNYSLTFFSSALLLVCLPQFIKLWIGNHYLLSMQITIMMVIIFIVNTLRYTCLVFIDAYGLAYEQKIKPFLEAVINLLLSIIFLKFFKLGIFGILLSSILTGLLIATTYEAYVVFHYGLQKKVFLFYKKYIRIVLEITFNLVAVYSLTSVVNGKLLISNFNILIVNTLITLSVSIITYILFNIKNSQFVQLRQNMLERFK
ncbi:lipopolysaccharide biosynthesis protein [Leuconostoc citreum]|uniref:lipopolysaccharide biosynthesis protein n=1 Tax=Leuconostoc citreum TaxID=33964 RepID=UPI001910E9BB|nr:oligosaccharide flippase family protein [Leuconostoc citreum]QQE97695.1 oligosaccharide flippase family protein [Leuconostoc citreum]